MTPAPLDFQIAERLQTLKRTVAVAESCTGGLLAAHLTAVPGSSATFPGGIIAYANAVKTRLLNVSESILAEHGAVSEPVARAMASGVRTLFGTDIGIGITGIAGPDGGTPQKPVGLVWIALADAQGVTAQDHVFTGNRTAVRQAACLAALEALSLTLSRNG